MGIFGIGQNVAHQTGYHNTQSQSQCGCNHRNKYRMIPVTQPYQQGNNKGNAHHHSGADFSSFKSMDHISAPPSDCIHYTGSFRAMQGISENLLTYQSCLQKQFPFCYTEQKTGVSFSTQMVYNVTYRVYSSVSMYKGHNSSSKKGG